MLWWENLAPGWLFDRPKFAEGALGLCERPAGATGEPLVVLFLGSVELRPLLVPVKGR